MTDRPRLLLVDDEAQIHRVLRPILEASGYAVESATTGTDALQRASAHGPACILLDLGLPDIDGFEVLRKLRGFSNAPVLILSARDRVAEKITMLDSGANDYVEKPFDTGELLARIRAALRVSSARETAPLLHLPPLEIDFERRRVTVAGERVTLTPREYDLLVVLARNAGRVVTHRQILASVWGPAHAQDVQYLRVYIGQLRTKLGVASHLISTEPGIGYRLAEDTRTA